MNHTQKVCSDVTYVCFFMLLVFVIHSCLMICNIYLKLLYHCTNYVLLKFLGIHYSLKNMTFLSSFEMKEYLLPHLMLKEGVGVSDSNVILTLSVGT